MILVLALFLSPFGRCPAGTQDTNELPIKMTYDFSYPDVISRENITEESMALSDTLNRALDLGIRTLSGTDDLSRRKGLSIVTALLLGIVEYSIDTSEHEMGHLQAFSRAGFNTSHFLYKDGSDRTRHVNDFFDVMKNVLPESFGIKGAAVTLDLDGWIKFYANLDLVAHQYEFLAVMEAGGLNQSQYGLEKRADRILEGKAIIFDGPIWLWQMMSTLTYSTKIENGDITDYLDDLDQIGIRSNIGHVKNIQWLKFLSGSSIAMWTGVYNFFDHTEVKVAAPLLPYLPEFASYLTTHGPTLKIRKPMIERGLGVVFEPSFQFSLDDTKHEEYGLRLKRQPVDILAVTLGGFINRAHGFWLEGGLTLSPFPWLDLGVSMTYGSGFTYEREIIGKTFSFLQERESSVKGSIAIYFEF